MSMLLDTKFADMPSGVAKRWLAWAQSHDWGHNAFYQDAGVLAGCADAWDAPLFSTPRELRDWAGY